MWLCDEFGIFPIDDLDVGEESGHSALVCIKTLPGLPVGYVLQPFILDSRTP